MKVTVRVNEFKRLLEEARCAIQSKPIIPALGHVKVDVFSAKRATVSSGDLEKYLVQPFEVIDGDAGSFLLHAKKAYDFLKGYKDGTATIEVDNKCIIQVGKATAKISTLSVDQFPPVEAMPEVKFEISLKFFKRLLERVERAAPDKAGKHSVTSVQFEGDGKRFRAVASDGFRIAIAEATCDCAEFTFLIPKSCLPVFKRREGKVFQFAESETNFFFRTDSGVITQVRKPMHKFPPYQQALSLANFKTEVKVQTSALKEGMRQIGATVDRMKPKVVFTVSESGLRLRTSEEEGGASETEVAATVSGIPNEVRFNPRFINDFLSQAEGEITVQIIDGTKLVKVSNDPNYIYLVMPLVPEETKKEVVAQQADSQKKMAEEIAKDNNSPEVVAARQAKETADKEAMEKEWKEVVLWRAYWNAKLEGKPLEKPTRLQFQQFTARCTKLCRDVLPKADKGAAITLLPFLRKVFGVQDLSQASVLQWEQVLARLEGAPDAAAAYQVIKGGVEAFAAQENPSPVSA